MVGISGGIRRSSVVACGGEVEMSQDLEMHFKIKGLMLLLLFLMTPLLMLTWDLFLTALQDGRHCVIGNADQGSI